MVEGASSNGSHSAGRSARPPELDAATLSRVRRAGLRFAPKRRQYNPQLRARSRGIQRIFRKLVGEPGYAASRARFGAASSIAGSATRAGAVRAAGARRRRAVAVAAAERTALMRGRIARAGRDDRSSRASNCSSQFPGRRAVAAETFRALLNGADVTDLLTTGENGCYGQLARPAARRQPAAPRGVRPRALVGRQLFEQSREVRRAYAAARRTSIRADARSPLASLTCGALRPKVRATPREPRGRGGESSRMGFAGQGDRNRPRHDQLRGRRHGRRRARRDPERGGRPHDAVGRRVHKTTASASSARSPSARRSPTRRTRSTRSSASWAGATTRCREETSSSRTRSSTGKDELARGRDRRQARTRRPRSRR